MKIEILSMNTSMPGGEHLSKVVWDISRGGNSSKLIDVIRVNAPVNEMPSILLHITSTIIEREVIASIREHSMWSSSSRVDDITKFEIDKALPIEARAIGNDLRSVMLDAKKAGFGQDQYRLSLPLTSLTHYVVRLNMRACAMLSSYFKELSKLNEVTQALFAQASYEMRVVCLDMGGEVCYPVGDLLGGYLDERKLSCATMVGDYVHVSLIAPFSLRTHLIRHRLISMRDEIKNWIRDGIHTRSIGDPIYIEAMAPIESWTNIYAKRACWIAQADLWDPILNLVMGTIGTENAKLPCDGGECPVQKDCYLRLEGKDPNPPCPLHAELYEIELTDDQVNRVKREIIQGDRSPYWRRYIA